MNPLTTWLVSSKTELWWAEDGVMKSRQLLKKKIKNPKTDLGEVQHTVVPASAGRGQKDWDPQMGIKHQGAAGRPMVSPARHDVRAWAALGSRKGKSPHPSTHVQLLVHPQCPRLAARCESGEEENTPRWVMPLSLQISGTSGFPPLEVCCSVFCFFSFSYALCSHKSATRKYFNINLEHSESILTGIYICQEWLLLFLLFFV